MKVASAGGIGGAGHLALDGIKATLLHHNARHFSEESLCVRMIWPTENLFRRSFLDDPSEIHDDDAIREMADDAEVVADEEVGQLKLFAKIHEQVQNLRLDRDIQGRHGFITDQDVGIHGECAGDTDALSLSTAELMRIARLERGLKAGAPQLSVHEVCFVYCDQLVKARSFRDDLCYVHTRIKRCVGILENHLYLEFGRNFLFP